MAIDSLVMSMCLITWTLPAAGPADWPEFRGAGGAGVAPGKLVVVGGKLADPAWFVPVAGQGWSSPVILGDLLILTAAEPDGEPAKSWRFVVLGLDSATGKERFRSVVFERKADSLPKIHSKNSHASPSATFSAAGVVAHFGHVGTALLDFGGKVLWSKEGIYDKPVHGGGASPVVLDGKVLIPCDGTDVQALVALDLKSGREVWRRERAASAARPFSFSTVCPISPEGNSLLLSAASDVLQQVDAASGAEIWRMPYTGYSVIPRPMLVGGGLAVLSTGYDKPSLLAVKLDGVRPGEERIAWKMEKNAPNTPTPLVLDGELLVLADNGVISSLEPASGIQRWQERLKGAYSASPISIGGQVVTVSEEGVVTAFKTGKAYQKIASTDLNERSLSSPAVASGRLFIRPEKGLRAWKLSD